MDTALHLWDDWAVFTVGQDIWLDKKHMNPDVDGLGPGHYFTPPVPGDWSLDALHLGSDPEATVRPAALAQLGAKLGVSPLPQLPLNQVLGHYVLGFNTPPGQKGLRMTRRGVALRMGDYGDVLKDGFSTNHPAWDMALKVRKQDYRDHVNRGTPIEVLRQWNGYDMLKFFGELSGGYMTLLVPADRIFDGHSRPSSTFSDLMTDTNGTALTSHTPTVGTSWSMNGGTAEIQSNRAENASDPMLGQMTDNLSSDDMSVEADTEMTVTGTFTARWRGVAARVASSGLTAYLGAADDADLRLIYWAAGTYNTVAAAVGDGGTGSALLTLTVDGSDLGVTFGASAELTGTDANITGNLRGGIAGDHTGANRLRYDNYVESDLPASSGRSMGSLAARGGLAGMAGLAGRGGGIAGD